MWHRGIVTNLCTTTVGAEQRIASCQSDDTRNMTQTQLAEKVIEILKKKMRDIRETSTLWQDVDIDRKGGAQSDRNVELMWPRECKLEPLAGKQPFAGEKVSPLYIGHGPWEVRTSSGWRKKCPFSGLHDHLKHGDSTTSPVLNSS